MYIITYHRIHDANSHRRKFDFASRKLLTLGPRRVWSAYALTSFTTVQKLSMYTKDHKEEVNWMNLRY